ncbi:LOW QUALITY PROTEIN: hypothetical protein V1477_011527 [Vespula maculifrons]|uniref:Uncharacterized protein n=1 Tax=Vespula maculifrons TaxID=7453 RepID=A0ABD2C128_VESMC
MSPRGRSYYDRHFFFSNQLVQYILGFRPNQSSLEALLLCSAVIAYLLPLIVYQFYQLYTIDGNLQSAIKMLKSILSFLFVLYCYITACFSLTTIKLLFSHVRLDYELATSEEELSIMEKYTNRSRLYVRLLTCRSNKMSTSNCKMILQLCIFFILNVFLYIFGTKDDILLTLPFPVHNILQPGLLYYSILCFSFYWILMHHAYGQFIIIMYVLIRKEYLYLFISNNIYLLIIKTINIVHLDKEYSARQPFSCDERYTANPWGSRPLQGELDWMIDIIKCHKRVTELIFQLFRKILNRIEAIEGFIYMIMLVFTLHFNFYLGQLLINYSNAAFRELCNIPFYILSIKTQKLFLFLLTRSIKPCEISIFGIFVISHKVLAAIIQRAFSLAMHIPYKNTKVVFKQEVSNFFLRNFGKSQQIFVKTSSNKTSLFKVLVLYLRRTMTNKGYVNVRHFVMYQRGLTHFEQHFFFSNRPVQLFLGLYTNQNSYNQMFVFCVVMVHILPLVMHQYLNRNFVSDTIFYQIYTLGIKMKSILKVLKLMMPVLQFVYCYVIFYFSLTKTKLLFAHMKFDYEFVTNEEELNIMEKYTNRSRLYVRLLTCRSNKMSTSNCKMILQLCIFFILNVFLYIFGTKDGILLTLPFPVHNILQPGLLYYSLLIYQIITSLIIIIIGILCYSFYWILVHHAYGQFIIIMYNICIYLYPIIYVGFINKKKARQPFSCDERYTVNPWGSRPLQGELDWMIDIIKCHKRVTEFIDLMNNFSRMIYLIALFTSLIFIFFHFLYVFQLFNKILNTREITEDFVYLIVFLSTLYINFYMGQLLINCSNAAFTELCNIPFYILSIKTQKMLLFLLTRSIKPSVISISGIFVLSYQVLSAVRNFAIPNFLQIFFMLTTNILFQITRKAFSFAMVYYTIKSITSYLLLYRLVSSNICYSFPSFVPFRGRTTSDKSCSHKPQLRMSVKVKRVRYKVPRVIAENNHLRVRHYKTIKKKYVLTLCSTVGKFSRQCFLSSAICYNEGLLECTMKGSEYYEQHFLLSKEIVQFILGVRRHQNSKDLLFFLCVVTIYVLPMIVHQLSTLDIKLNSNYKILQKTLCILCIICIYANVCFHSPTVRTIFITLSSFIIKYIYIHMQKLLVNFTNRMDNCELFLDKNELYILDKYVKQSKLITIIFASSGSLYGISITLPSILSVFFNIFGTVNGVHVTLPFPVNNVSNAGPFYYGLLIYQITAIFIMLIITCVSFSSYLVIIQHACVLFKFLMIKINQPFKDQKNSERAEMDCRHNSPIYKSYGILQFPTILKNADETFECFVVIVGSLSTTYINFYMGQMVIDHSIAVFQELCQVPFYTLSGKAQKLLLLIIARSMKPCYISIGGIFIASHEIFAKIIQKVLSFTMNAVKKMLQIEDYTSSKSHIFELCNHFKY